MIFRNLDENGDWTFGRGLSDYTVKDQAIALNIKTRIMSWLGDCFFAEEEGIDWVNRLGSKNQRELLEMDLRLMIMQSFGVNGITSFFTTLNDRKFVASYSINTIYSELTDTIEVGI